MLALSGCGSEYHVVSTTPSTDGEFSATIYNEMGGGAAGWCYVRTTVNTKSIPFDIDRQRKDKDRTDVVFASSCGAEIKTQWTGPRNLVISYRSYDKNFPIEVYQKEVANQTRQVTVAYIQE